MRVITPIDVTLISTSVAENTEDEWAEDALYSMDDTVQVTTSFPNKVYKSLVDNNYGRIPEDHLEGVIESATSATNLSVGNGDKNLTVEAHKAFTPGMVVQITHATKPRSYHMTAEVVSYDEGSGALAVSAYQSTGDTTAATWIVESDEEVIFWEEVGATNRHRMFDDYFNTETISDSVITVTISADRCDAISLLGLQCMEVQLRLLDCEETTEYWSETIDMVAVSSDTGPSDWWEYWFGEFRLHTTCNALFETTVADAILEIRIIPASGAEAKCAALVIGRGFHVGTIQYGGSVELLNYSGTETDDQGRTTLKPGNKSKLNQYTVVVQDHRKDLVFDRMEELVDVATVYIGTDDDDVELFTVFGFHREFSLVWSGPVKSYCNLEINGLI